MRKYGDLLAYFNYEGYKQLVYFEKYFVYSLISNFQDMCHKSIKLITTSHEFWAELSSSFSEFKKILAYKTPIVVN